MTRAHETKAQAIDSSKRQNSLIVAAMALMLISIAVLVGMSSARADETLLAPSADYRPRQVVRIVVDSLQDNSVNTNDSGIATVFRFASPVNRANTGPLKRFTRMVKTGFSDMLNHSGARYDEMEITDDKAIQAVWLLTDTGTEVGYAFQLGLQKSGEFEGMWMTDAVIPLGKSAQSGIRI